MYTVFWLRNLRERDNLEDSGVDGRIIIRWIFSNWDVGHGLDQSDSGYGHVAGTCKRGNVPSGPIKCVLCLNYLKNR